MTRQRPFIGGFLILLSVVLLLPTPAGAQEQATGTSPAAGAPQAAPAPSEVTTPPAPSAEQPGTYTIREGDTLWDISSAHYRDPFLWPLIWQANPEITNPDLIYPGRALVIPSLAPVERAISAPEEAAPAVAVERPAPVAAAPAPQESASAVPSFFSRKTVESSVPAPEKAAPGGKLVTPEDVRQPLVDKYAMLSGGFVSEGEDSEDRVVGSVDDAATGKHGQNIHATGQPVYISVTSRPQVNVGDRFIIYAPVHAVRHPETRDSYGTLYKVNGVAQVTSAHENNVYTAEIVLAFDAVMKNDMLMPYQEPQLIYPSPVKRSKDITGFILDVTDRKILNSQGQVVFLDKGREDGVETGDRFSVYAGKTNESGVPQYLGDVLVFIVKDRTSTALVRNSLNEMTKGDRLEYKK